MEKNSKKPYSQFKLFQASKLSWMKLLSNQKHKHTNNGFLILLISGKK